MKITQKKQFSLNARDWIQGIYVSVIAPIVALILQELSVGNFNLDWKQYGILTLSTLALYLLKNYLQPDKVIITEPKGELYATSKPHPGSTPIHPPKK